MPPHETPGGWYSAILPDGSYVTLVRQSHFETSQGIVPLSPAGEILQLDLGPQRRFAGHSHDDNNAWEWMPAEGNWVDRGVAVGPRCALYDAAGTLQIVRRTGTFTGSQGWRYVADDGHLVASWETYDPSTPMSKARGLERLWEWIEHGDLIIGQGEGGVIAFHLPTRKRYWLARGQTTFIKYARAGNTIAVAWVQEDRNSSCRWILSLADVLAQPEDGGVVVHPPPPPPPPPEPTVGVPISELRRLGASLQAHAHLLVLHHPSLPFCRAVAKDLGGRWGLNGKRGSAADLSRDIVTYLEPSNVVHLYDVVSAAFDPAVPNDPKEKNEVLIPGETDQGEVHQNGDGAIWLDPNAVSETPTPPPPPVVRGPSLDAWIHQEFPQLVTEFKRKRPELGEPGNEWAAFQTYRRYVEGWSFDRVFAGV